MSRRNDEQMSFGNLLTAEEPTVKEALQKAKEVEKPKPKKKVIAKKKPVEDLDTPKVFSISELNKQIKSMLEGTFAIVWVKGEISNFKAHSSGHYYFSLKDEKSQMNAVMFRGYNSRLKFRPEDGMEVMIRGKVTVYEPRGNYQIFCETMEAVGAGALQLAYEQLKAKLKSEGLFSAERKKELPALPNHVALVTSPTGAAVKDMLNVLGRRFSGLKITVLPCQVQGERAAGTIVKALEDVERLNQTEPVDVVICGRGGGSMEDLWAFNDEALARKIAGLEIPIVSAVGHEVDFTIADFVADLRAPTPSAAAELVVKNASELIDRIEVLKRRLYHQYKSKIQMSRQVVEGLSKRLVDPQRYLQDMAIRCDDLLQRLEMSMQNFLSNYHLRVELLTQKLGNPEEKIQRQREQLGFLEQQLKSLVARNIEGQRQKQVHLSSLLDSLSPLKVVDRGYSIVTMEGEVVKDASSVKKGQPVEIRFAKGSAEAEIKKVKKGK